MPPLPEKTKKPDRRQFTLMLVPHQGDRVYRRHVPIKTLKIMASVGGIIGSLLLAGFVHYQVTLQRASSEIDELATLRRVNTHQAVQIDLLAQNTSALQSDMIRLNQLDAELRRLIAQEDSSVTSRSGVTRPPAGSSKGEGGPVVKPNPVELNSLAQDLTVTAKSRLQSLQSLREILIERNARLAAAPSIWPANGTVTSRFGWRWGGSDWHPGIDIAADTGTPIYAAAEGLVTVSSWQGGYGKQVQIEHGYGVATIYAHNSENVVSVGQKVIKGQLVAYMGSTGFSTGPHVHYEVRVNGNAVDPAKFL